MPKKQTKYPYQIWSTGAAPRTKQAIVQNWNRRDHRPPDHEERVRLYNGLYRPYKNAALYSLQENVECSRGGGDAEEEIYTPARSAECDCIRSGQKMDQRLLIIIKQKIGYVTNPSASIAPKAL